MRDAELKAALEGNNPMFDTAFRVRVLEHICKRARRRTMTRRAAVWITAGIGAGLLAQTLTPPETGVESLEAIAMAASLGATAMALAMTTVTSNTAEFMHRALFAAARH